MASSFSELSAAGSAPEVAGNGHAHVAALDEVVAPRPAETALRRRLRALQRATDRELRSRGLVSLPAVTGEQGATRLRVQTRALRNALGGLTERQRSRAVQGAFAGLARLPRPPLPRRIPSRESLQQELPMQLMGGVGQLAISLRNLTGRDVIDLESLNELLSFAFRAAEVRKNHQQLQYTLDDFGFDREWTEAILPLAKLVYRKYWRVETTGVQHVPRRGAALLVSNHAGVLPFDGAMIKTALFEHGLDRHARALIADWFFTLPVLSWLLRRSGQTLGDPRDTHRLLSAGELVLVFPEGVKGTGKLWSERYRLRRFGRGGFVETAIRAGAPIVPISVVGSEELYPMLADIRPLAQLTGFPYFPITPTWPWLGPLGLVPLPSKWRIEFHAPIRTDELPTEAADDPSVVMQYADRVRDTIQQGLVANLMRRRNAFRG
jgi:1-acyl-sn-glycerol-3-phosphate acyltransferase